MAVLPGTARTRRRIAAALVVLAVLGLAVFAAPAAARPPDARVNGAVIPMIVVSHAAGTSATVTLTAGARVTPGMVDVSARILQLIGGPSVAYVLLSLGLLGLFFELANPGGILPGVLGGICVLLALLSLGSLNVDWAGVYLIGFAFLLFAVDVYVPSHGALTVGGIVAFAAGSYLLHSAANGPFAQVSGVVIVATTLVIAMFFLFIAGAVIKARLRPPRTGREALVGAVGTVRRALDPEGYVFVEGELWRATSPLAPIEVGARVRVIAIEGLRLTVLPAQDEQSIPMERGA